MGWPGRLRTPGAGLATRDRPPWLHVQGRLRKGGRRSHGVGPTVGRAAHGQSGAHGSHALAGVDRHDHALGQPRPRARRLELERAARLRPRRPRAAPGRRHPTRRAVTRRGSDQHVRRNARRLQRRRWSGVPGADLRARRSGDRAGRQPVHRGLRKQPDSTRGPGRRHLDRRGQRHFRRHRRRRPGDAGRALDADRRGLGPRRQPVHCRADELPGPEGGSRRRHLDRRGKRPVPVQRRRRTGDAGRDGALWRRGRTGRQPLHRRSPELAHSDGGSKRRRSHGGREQRVGVRGRRRSSGPGAPLEPERGHVRTRRQPLHRGWRQLSNPASGFSGHHRHRRRLGPVRIFRRRRTGPERQDRFPLSRGSRTRRDSLHPRLRQRARPLGGLRGNHRHDGGFRSFGARGGPGAGAASEALRAVGGGRRTGWRDLSGRLLQSPHPAHRLRAPRRFGLRHPHSFERRTGAVRLQRRGPPPPHSRRAHRGAARAVHL